MLMAAIMGWVLVAALTTAGVFAGKKTLAFIKVKNAEVESARKELVAVTEKGASAAGLLVGTNEKAQAEAAKVAALGKELRAKNDELIVLQEKLEHAVAVAYAFKRCHGFMVTQCHQLVDACKKADIKEIVDSKGNSHPLLGVRYHPGLNAFISSFRDDTVLAMAGLNKAEVDTDLAALSKQCAEAYRSAKADDTKVELTAGGADFSKLATTIAKKDAVVVS